MILGTCRIQLFIPAAGSLKAKRSVIKSLKDRIRSRFNVSIAAVAEHDLWQRATLWLVVVSNERKHADQTIAAVVRMIEREQRAELIDFETESL